MSFMLCSILGRNLTLWKAVCVCVSLILVLVVLLAQLNIVCGMACWVVISKLVTSR